jgi:hypothetical protein
MRSLPFASPLAAWVCASLCALTFSAAARAERVVNDGGDIFDGACDAHCTLRDAVSLADVGERVVLTVDVVLDRSIGITTDGVRLDGANHAIDAGQVRDGRPALHVLANDVVVENLRVLKAGDDCVVVERSPQRIANVTVGGCGGSGIIVPCLNSLEGLSADGVGDDGIRLLVGSARTCAATNLSVSRSAGNGIVVSGDFPDNSVLLSSVASNDNAALGIALESTAAVELSSSSATGNRKGGIAASGKNALVELVDVTGRGNTGAGLIVSGGATVDIGPAVRMQDNIGPGAIRQLWPLPRPRQRRAHAERHRRSRRWAQHAAQRAHRPALRRVRRWDRRGQRCHATRCTVDVLRPKRPRP